MRVCVISFIHSANIDHLLHGRPWADTWLPWRVVGTGDAVPALLKGVGWWGTQDLRLGL